MNQTPTTALRSMRQAAPLHLVRGGAPRGPIELGNLHPVIVVVLAVLGFYAGDYAVRALGLPPESVKIRNAGATAGAAVFLSWPLVLFTGFSFYYQKRFDFAEYVAHFTPRARFFFALGALFFTSSIVDIGAILLVGDKGGFRGSWIIGLSLLAAYYYGPKYLAARAVAPRRSPAREENQFCLFLGASTGALASLSHGAGIAPRQNVALSLQDAAQNVIVLGGIGSGKTTRAIQPLLTQLLDQDCGGLIFDIKGDFNHAVYSLAQDAGREVVTIGPERTQMNLLAGLTPEVAASFLKSAFIMNQRGSFDSFWIDTATQLSLNALGVLSFLPGRYSLSGLYGYLYDSSEREDVDEAVRLLEASGQLSPNEARLLKTYQGYHEAVFSKFDEKVQAGVNATIAQVLAPFNHPHLIDAFCTDDASAPSMEAVLDGTIYLVDMPLARWGLGGKVAYTFIKLRFFNVMQRRPSERDWNQERPVFFMCDEYQEIVSASSDGLSDLNFWDKSRSSKCIGIISAQSVSSVYAAVGSHDTANTVMQNFRQKICFRTEDKLTIETLNHLLGRVEIERVSTSKSEGSRGGSSKSKSVSTIERQVLNPQIFRQLGPDQAIAILSIDGRAADDVISCVPVFIGG